jgi:hypothetical protein
MAKRKSISTRTRFEIFKRDEFTCQYCGSHPPQVVLHVDHVVAVANGGSNDMDNLVSSCSKCNLGKSAVPLTNVPQSLAQRAADTAEREKQLAGYSSIFEAKRQRLDRDCWRVINQLFGKTTSIDRQWYGSVQLFVERLGVHSVLEAADAAAAWYGSNSADRIFRYFCGCCWNRIRTQQESTIA